jgi:ParB family chromosome partitioning protein
MEVKLVIVYKDPAALNPYNNNSKTHSDAQIDEIVESIKEFGFVDPIGIDDQDGIITGHGSTLAAIKLGMKLVPTTCLSHLSDRQKRAYIIAHNKLAEKSGWDIEKLSEEMNRLVNDDFDVSLTGFNEEELDKMLKDSPFLPEGTDGPTDDVEEEEKPRGKAKAKMLHTCPNCKHEFTA